MRVLYLGTLSDTFLARARSISGADAVQATVVGTAEGQAHHLVLIQLDPILGDTEPPQLPFWTRADRVTVSTNE